MNAKKLLSTLLSAAMAVSMLAGCFGGGGNKNYSDKAADAANAVQSTVVFATDAKLSKSLQDALENFTQLDDIKDAMEADENLKSLLTSGYDLDVVAEQGEDAEAAAKAIAEKYILSIVSGKKAEGKIAMVLHDGNGYYYVAVLTYGNGGSGSGGGAGGGSGSGDDGKPGTGDDDDEEENGHVFLKGITVTPPSTLVYVVGQEFQPEDMTITAFYSDGSSKDVTLDSKWECNLWNNKVFTTVGNSQVVVTYEGKKAAFSITVVPVTLTGIQVSGYYRTEYYEGQFFDNQKLVVEACYNNGDVKVVTDYKLSCDGFDGEDKLKPGKYNVVVEYEGFTAEIPISVTPIEWKSGEVTCSKTYTYGDTFEEDSLAVKVEYTDTSTETITKFDKIEFVPKNAINEDNRFTTAGEVKIQVTYTDKFGEAHEGSVTIKVNNKNPEIVGNLAVTTDKTFEVGDQIQPSDLTVTVAYKDALGKEWTETIKDFTITNPTGVFTKADDQYPVSVAYEDQYGNKATGSTTVTVEEKEHIVTVKWDEDQGYVKINNTSYKDNKDGKVEVKIEAGTKVVVQAVPHKDQGYVFNGFTGTSKDDGTVNEISHTYTIDSLSKDVSIGVNFKLTQVTVTLNLEGNGNGTVKFNDQKVEDGKFIIVDFNQAVTIKAEADSASELISINDGVNDLNINRTIIYPSHNVTITVTFESVQPEIARIEVTQDKDIYVGQTLTSEYLAVTAYDASGNKIANPGLTFNGTEQLLSEARGTNNPYKATVSYKDGDGNIYTPDGGYVPIVVKNPEITILTDGCEPFATGDTFFYHDEIFRKGMKIQFIYGENKGDPIEIHKNMVGSTILVTHYQTINDEWVDASGFSFDHPRDQNVKLLYVDNNGIFYEFIVRINVKGA